MCLVRMNMASMGNWYWEGGKGIACFGPHSWTISFMHQVGSYGRLHKHELYEPRWIAVINENLPAGLVPSSMIGYHHGLG